MAQFSVAESLVDKAYSSEWRSERIGRTCSTTWYVNLLSQTTSPHRCQSGEELPESERPSIDDVAQDGLLAIVAGSDTTSNTLTAVLYFLLHNPSAYGRLQEEVDSAFPSGEEPLDVSILSHMEWLNGCM
jgi:Cytochrome P450